MQGRHEDLDAATDDAGFQTSLKDHGSGAENPRDPCESKLRRFGLLCGTPERPLTPERATNGEHRTRKPENECV